MRKNQKRLLKSFFSLTLVIILLGLMMMGCSGPVQEEKVLGADGLIEKIDSTEFRIENKQGSYQRSGEELNSTEGLNTNDEICEERQNDWPEIIPEELKEEWEEHAYLNKIIMVMTHEASMDLKYYSVEDFPEIECSSVDHMNSFLIEKIKNAADGTEESNGFIGFGYYKAIVELFFEPVSVEELYQAIAALNRRSDVEIAGPCMRTEVELCVKDQNESLNDPDYWPDQIPEEYREKWEGNISQTSILVTLTFEESMKLKDYSAEDFAEIGCTNVVSLSKATVNIIKNAAPGSKEAEGFVGVGRFHYCLGIHFEEKTIDEIYESIITLMKREDVLSAGVNPYGHDLVMCG